MTLKIYTGIKEIGGACIDSMYSRGLSPEFLSDLQSGYLHPLVEYVQQDYTLFLAIRKYGYKALGGKAGIVKHLEDIEKLRIARLKL